MLDGGRLITRNIKRFSALLLIISMSTAPLQYALADDVVPMTLHLPASDNDAVAKKPDIKLDTSIKPYSCVNYKGGQKVYFTGGTQSAMANASRRYKRQPVLEDYLIVSLKKDADREDFDSKVKELNGTLDHTINVGALGNLLVIQTEPGTAVETQKKLRADKNVAIVQRNRWCRLMQASAPPNDLLLGSQYDLTIFHYPQARAIGRFSNTLATAFLIDTGIQPIGFGELATKILQFDFSDPNKPTGNLEKPQDVIFHGTGTVTPFCGTNNVIGYAGVGNFDGDRCGIVECRITQKGSGGFTSLIDIYESIAFCYVNIALGRFATGPVNLSFGSTGGGSLNADPIIQTLANGLITVGSLLILSAGNTPTEDPSPELAARRIAATDQNNMLASFSTFGPFNRAAPGVNVPCYVPYSYPLPFFESGTSFSAPRWAACVLDVMLALRPGIRSALLADQILENTATVTAQGWHIPNLFKAILAASKR
jgi:hypothetical protein